MTANPFVQASRKTVKARIALEGPSGSGKTYTGLVLAAGMANGGRVAVIDTEKGSASTYADEFDFDVLELGPPFSPDRYVEAIHAAEQAGYDVILVDSLSHAWFDEGGVLDIVDKEAGRGGNKFAGWQKGTPAQNSLIGAVVRSPIHVIATMRTKTEYVQETQNGRTTIRKIGLAPIQRDGVDYEFTVVGSIALDHVMTITKSRFRSLQDQTFRKPGPEVAAVILRELESGESVEAPPAGTEAGEQRSRAGSQPDAWPTDQEASTGSRTDGQARESHPAASTPEPARSETGDGGVDREGHATAPDPEEGGPSEVETPASGATPEQFDRLIRLYETKVKMLRAAGVSKQSEITFAKAEELILAKASA